MYVISRTLDRDHLVFLLYVLGNITACGIKLVLAIAASYKLRMRGGDLVGAYLVTRANKHYPVFIKTPKGMSKPVLNIKDLWTFWTLNALILPNYFAVASAVALISPSTAVCERLLARLLMGFGDDQENALQDYKSASTMMRFNSSLMKSSGLLPH